MLTSHLLVTDKRALQFGLDIEKLKCQNSAGTDQIPKEFIKADCRTFRCEIHKISYFYLE
jgi:hypothetical protein